MPAEIEAPLASEAVPVLRHDLNRYMPLADHDIRGELAKRHYRPLLRRNLQSILARCEMGGMVFEVARRHPNDRDRFEWLVQKTLELRDRPLAHPAWVHWPRALITLERLQVEARQRRMPFVVPGLRALLRLAGVAEQRRVATISVDPPVVLPSRLPDDLPVLKAIIRKLMAQDREQRAVIVTLRGEVMHGRQRFALARAEIAGLRRKFRQMPNRVAEST